MNAMIASEDVTVDAGDGTRRKIVKGTEVPPPLLAAYLDETGEEAPEGEPPQPEGTLIASKDISVKGPDGLARRIIKGTVVPPWLHRAYADETGEDVPEAPGEEEVGAKAFASDSAEELADELGVSLDDIAEPSGSGGKATVADVKAAAGE